MKLKENDDGTHSLPVTEEDAKLLEKLGPTALQALWKGLIEKAKEEAELLETNSQQEATDQQKAAIEEGRKQARQLERRNKTISDPRLRRGGRGGKR